MGCANVDECCERARGAGQIPTAARMGTGSVMPGSERVSASRGGTGFGEQQCESGAGFDGALGVAEQLLRDWTVGDDGVAPRVGFDQFRQQFEAQTVRLAGDRVHAQARGGGFGGHRCVPNL